MKFHDPLRPRLLNGVPCWLSAPSVALPRLHVTPSPRNGELYAVEVIIDGSQKFCFATIRLLRVILENWSLDPEQALQTHLGVPPPRAYTPSLQTQSKSSKPVAQLVAREGTTIEDLGL